MVKDIFDARDPHTAAWLVLNDIPYYGAHITERGQVAWRFSNQEPQPDTAWQLALLWRNGCPEDRVRLAVYGPDYVRAYKLMTADQRVAQGQGYDVGFGNGGAAHDFRRSA